MRNAKVKSMKTLPDTALNDYERAGEKDASLY
jgi:hypothetical protein